MTSNITISTKQHLAFKSAKQLSGERNQGFKAGGPIRATGAAIQQMEIIQPGGFSNTQSSFKQVNTPQVASKMPQRPGSSKPIQKGGLLSQLETDKLKRPDSSKNKTAKINLIGKQSRMRSASPNTLTLQQQKSGDSNPPQSSSKLKGRMNVIPGSSNFR